MGRTLSFTHEVAENGSTSQRSPAPSRYNPGRAQDEPRTPGSADQLNTDEITAPSLTAPGGPVHILERDCYGTSGE